MKLSAYNIWADIANGKVLYNSLYKNIVELSTKEFEMFEELVSRELVPSDEESATMLKLLAEQMFVIDDDMDELAYFKLGWNRSLYASGIIRHTLLPNLSCNLDCPYCFENKNGTFMTRETELAYVNWLNTQLVDVKSFYMTWFGGEPLLSKGTIERITNGILRLEEKYSFEYTASLVTNGVLLDESFIERVDDLRIKSVQVTLDGDKINHDTYRYIKNTSQGTFDTIMENMARFCSRGTSDVASIIRINVTDENYTGIASLLEKIPAIVKEKCFLLFRWVYANSGGRSPGKEFSAKLKGSSPFTNIALLYRLADSMGFITNTLDEGITYNFCECDFDKTFHIDQNGDIFMCSHSMSEDDSVGNVREGFSSQKGLSKYAQFIGANPFSDEACLNCVVLPICKGGCRKARCAGKKACSEVAFDTKSYVLQKYHKSLKTIAT